MTEKKKTKNNVIVIDGLKKQLMKFYHSESFKSLSSCINLNGKDKTITIRERVKYAREIQEKRFKDANRKIATNSEMSARDITLILKISDEVKEILNKSAKTLDLSARSYHKIIKLARTIADLDSSFEITPSHILEAISYRPKQSQY